ncbi:MAG TPA: HD-GYP domain-containing protein [Gammaproteobacteria bacterium]|nr:HD-GYP domain-containing protein [Gammaproteobacteria bacterium]
MESQHQQKVSTADLEVGMYVTRLDRPWTDTPFLFQGFFIGSQDDIDELRRLCQYVYIDPERHYEELPRIKARGTGNYSAVTQVTSVNLSTSRVDSRNERANRTVSASPHSMEEELPAGKQAYDEANHAMHEMITKLEADGRLDVQLAVVAVEPMVESVLRNPDAMIWLTRMKRHHDYMYTHSVSSAIWGIAFARHLGLNKAGLREIGLGCMLFDVGKVRLPRELLSKPDKLSASEWQVVRNHVDYSLNLLEGASEVTRATQDLVRWHHERHDGSGYPDGLKENEIPMSAKIAGMVDSYDAITTARPYSHLRSPYEAVREIYTWRGTLFQSEVVEQFMQVVGVFPTGSLVELNDGSVAVVLAQNDTRRLKPRVMLILDENKQRLPQFTTLDLMFDSHLKGLEKLWIEKGLEPGAYGIDPEELYL